MANILILGGGFGGLIAAEKLVSALGSSSSAHHVTLVSPSRKFVFYPALVQVAFGRFEPGDISFDLRKKAFDLGIRFVEGEAVHLNPKSRSVSVAKEDYAIDHSYDFLILALGRRLMIEKMPGFYEHAHHLLNVQAALKFGEAVRDFRAGRIVVGMCPGARLPVPACETAFALARQFEREISERKVSIAIVFPKSVREAFAGAKIYWQLETAFEMHDIEVIENFPVKEIGADKIMDDGGRAMKHDLLMLVPPFGGHEMLKNSGAADESGFIPVNLSMQVEDLPQIYAAGDCTAFPGPKLAQMAVSQAAVAAKNIAAEIKGEQPKEVYLHEIATIIDAGGDDSIYLHYGVWDDELYRLQKGALWSWAKDVHDRYWRAMHG